jgi:hypothetical protein
MLSWQGPRPHLRVQGRAGRSRAVAGSSNGGLSSQASGCKALLVLAPFISSPPELGSSCLHAPAITHAGILTHGFAPPAFPSFQPPALQLIKISIEKGQAQGGVVDVDGILHWMPFR